MGALLQNPVVDDNLGENDPAPLNCFSIDVEEWFHLLDSPAVPPINEWAALESRVETNVDWLLEMMDQTGVQATFFWLGWMAERYRPLLHRCQQGGHEIASHGYGHVEIHRRSRCGFA